MGDVTSIVVSVCGMLDADVTRGNKAHNSRVDI